MTNVPKNIKVLVFNYTVTESGEAMAEVRYNTNSSSATGAAEPRDLTITLDPKSPYDMKAHDLLHEVGHAVHWAAGLFTRDKVGVHEYLTRTTPILLAVLRDNPELVEFLTNRHVGDGG